MLALAGINSSLEAQAAGKNEHLRSFSVQYLSDHIAATSKTGSTATATEEKASSRIKLISQRSLFQPSIAARKESYQRVLRLSPAVDQDSTSRIAALATGLAPEGEVVFVRAHSGTDADELLGRITLDQGQEAADVDMIVAPDESQVAAYCTDYEVSVCRLNVKGSKSMGESSQLESKCVYITPHPDVFASEKARSVFRSLRFLAPGLVLLLSNKPRRSGTELLVLRYGEGLGEIILRRQLHRSMKGGVGLETSSLGHHGHDSKQMVVAVAGQDISIEILVLELHTTRQSCRFSHHATVRDVHPFQMTKICLSNIQSAEKESSTVQLRIGSVSMGNTVVIHSLPLTRVDRSSGRPGYVISRPTHSTRVIVSLIVLVLAIVLGMFARPTISLPGLTYLPRGIPSYWSGQGVEDANLHHPKTPTHLRELLRGEKHQSGGRPNPLLVRIDADRISVTMHDTMEGVAEKGRRWEDLAGHEKDRWKQRLSHAGEWAFEEGEAILKGVFFGELGREVGQAIHG